MYDPNREYPFAQSSSMIVHADRRPHVDHKSRMVLRRARQNERTVGFIPTKDNAFDKSVSAAFNLLKVEYGDVRSDPELRAQAYSDVRATLPKPPLGVKVKRNY